MTRVQSITLVFLLLLTIASPAFAEQKFDKEQYLTICSDYLKSVPRGDGLSSQYFQVCENIPGLVSTVRDWLDACWISPEYLGSNEWAKYAGINKERPSGFTQPKGFAETAMNVVSPGETKYNGCVIMPVSPAADHVTSAHEFIHAYHCAIGDNHDYSMDKSQDRCETITNSFIGKLREFRVLDTMLQDVKARRRPISTLDVIWNRAVKACGDMTHPIYQGDFQICLKNIDGKSDPEGYLNALKELIKQMRDPLNSFEGQWRSTKKNGSLMRIYGSGTDTKPELSAKVVEPGGQLQKANVPADSWWFIGATVNPRNPLEMNSSRTYCYAYSDCPKLKPFKTGRIKLVLDPRTDKLTVTRTVPLYWGTDCEWAIKKPWDTDVEIWTRED